MQHKEDIIRPDRGGYFLPGGSAGWDKTFPEEKLKDVHEAE